MADETIDRKAAEAEAQADAAVVTEQDKDAEKVVAERRKARGADKEKGNVTTAPAFANTDPVDVEKLPSVKDKNVNLLSGPRVDPNEGWTNQSEVGYVVTESIPGTYVQPHELPTKEGLEASGVTDPAAYLAAVPVRKVK